MNPAFPTVVYWIPNCWKLLARQRATPQQIPPIIRVFLAPGITGTCSFLFILPVKKPYTGKKDDTTHKASDAVKCKWAHVIHSNALRHKGHPPYGGCQQQQKRIFYLHSLTSLYVMNVKQLKTTALLS